MFRRWRGHRLLSILRKQNTFTTRRVTVANLLVIDVVNLITWLKIQIAVALGVILKLFAKQSLFQESLSRIILLAISRSVKKQVRCVEEQPIDDKPEYVFSLSQEEKGHVALDVGGVVIEMLIDSGASFNVIDQCTWNMMKKKTGEV